MVRRWRNLVLALGLFTALGACVGLGPGPEPTALPSPSPWATQTPTPRATEPPAAHDIRIWVAASLGPEMRPAAWQVLSRARDEFATLHGVTVEVRVKPDWGPHGLVEALVWARAAAPEAAPDLILAPVEVLEAARAKIPWPEHAAGEGAASSTTWYPFARAAVREHQQVWARPVAAEAPVLAWPNTAAEDVPTTWDAWLTSSFPWTWAARDPWAWSVWAFYYAAGGEVYAPTQPRLLNAEPLADLFAFLVQARWNAGLRSDATRWTSMHALAQDPTTQEVARVLWSSDVLSADNTAWGPLPGPQGPGPLLMRVYAWAIVADDPTRQALATTWLARITSTDWNAAWTRAGGWWPVEPQTLRRSWGAAQAEAWEPWLQQARPAPPLAVHAATAQALRAAVLRVLNGAQTPLEAAQQVLQALGVSPPTLEATPTPQP